MATTSRSARRSPATIGPDYVYLLNSDAFPEPGAIRRLVDFLDGNPSAGIAGSFIHGPDGESHRPPSASPPSPASSRAPLRVRTDLAAARTLHRGAAQTAADAAGGLARGREHDDAHGGARRDRAFRRAFFLYYEETDFCRARQLAGWPTYYVPESSVAHIGSASTGMKDKRKRTPGYWFDSRRHYFLKNHGSAYADAATAGACRWAALTARALAAAAASRRPIRPISCATWSARGARRRARSWPAGAPPDLGRLARSDTP